MAKAAGKGKKKSRHIFRKIILTLIILVILGLGGLYAYDQLKQEYTVTYDGYTATVGTISNSLSFSGTLQLIDSKTYTASSATSVREVFVQAGDTVKKGQNLLRLTNGKTFTADFDGKVNTVSVAAGDEVTKEQELMQIADFDHMKVSIRVDEYDISDVKAGDACRVTTTATENTFDSVIDNINYVSSSSGSVAYYTAIAYVDVREGVYPGMQVTVTIPKEEAANVVILKEDALSFDRTNQAFVYQKDETGALQQVFVKTGVSNGNYVEITEGLRSGDSVFVEVETEVSGTASLLSSLFGRQNYMGGSGRGTQNGAATRNSNSGGSGSWPGGTGGSGSGTGGFGGGRP